LAAGTDYRAETLPPAKARRGTSQRERESLLRGGEHQ